MPSIRLACRTSYGAQYLQQNLFAECLLKSLAAYGPDGRRTGQPGGWESGAAIVRATLSKLGVDLTGAVLRDGSGLSHSNRASAAQIVRLLAIMKRHRHADVFLESLAVPGELGSMRRRYARIGPGGRLRAKTGTLAQVHSLAGYVERADERCWRSPCCAMVPCPVNCRCKWPKYSPTTEPVRSGLSVGFVQRTPCEHVSVQSRAQPGRAAGIPPKGPIAAVDSKPLLLASARATALPSGV